MILRFVHKNKDPLYNYIKKVKLSFPDQNQKTITKP